MDPSGELSLALEPAFLEMGLYFLMSIESSFAEFAQCPSLNELFADEPFIPSL